LAFILTPLALASVIFFFFFLFFLFFQHDILFDLLTVKEHLELFAAIKDVPKEETEAAIDEMISQVGLTEKVNDKSAALSGGMKRKLSVGIALLGDSKIVFLSVFSRIAHARLRIRGVHSKQRFLSLFCFFFLPPSHIFLCFFFCVCVTAIQ